MLNRVSTGLCLYSTWSVVDVGHGATFGGDVAHVDLLGLDLDLWAAAESTNLSEKVQYAL